MTGLGPFAWHGVMLSSTSAIGIDELKPNYPLPTTEKFLCSYYLLLENNGNSRVHYRTSELTNCDDVMYRDSTIYAVVEGGGLLSCKITEPAPRLRKVAPPPLSCPLLADGGNYYILESPQGEILMVCRIVVEATLNDNSFEPVFRTSEFKVFKVLVLGRLTAWVRMKSLGDKALFLGANHSTCISASHDFPGCQPNSIYFTDDNLVQYANALRIPADMGIFNLEDLSF